MDVAQSFRTGTCGVSTGKNSVLGVPSPAVSVSVAFLHVPGTLGVDNDSSAITRLYQNLQQHVSEYLLNMHFQLHHDTAPAGERGAAGRGGTGDGSPQHPDRP